MEEGTENTQTLEGVLSGDSSTEVEEVSEEPTEENEKTTEETAEKAEADEEKAEGTEELSPELEAEVKRRVQAEVDKTTDKKLNTYRETHQKDAAYISSLKKDLSEAKGKLRVKEDDSRIKAILSGDEEDGKTAEETKGREAALKEFSERYQEFQEKYGELEEAAEAYSQVSERLPKNIVESFGLNDPNPTAKAINGIRFFEETVSVYKTNQDFLKAVERVAPKGSDFRVQVEKLVEGLAGFKDDASKELYLDKHTAGLKPTPRKKPDAPGGDTRGGYPSKLKGDAAVAAGLEEDRRKQK